LLKAHARGERVVVVIDEAQNLSPEALEQVRLLTNLETSKEKLLQIVLLGQPELRELLQRRNLRQLAQRITARYHLSPLGHRDTHLYIRHRMQIAGAQRNPFKRGAMNAVYQRSQGIPRLINIIADRALVAAFAKERMDVTAAMVQEAANEVQLGEHQVRRVRWPWIAVTASVVAVVALIFMTVSDWREQGDWSAGQTGAAALPASGIESEVQIAAAEADKAYQPVEQVAEQAVAELDSGWLRVHQDQAWQGMAELWNEPGAAFAIQAACNGDNDSGYACLGDQGSWSKIRRLGLPVILQLQVETPAYLLLRGIDDERLLVGKPDQAVTVSKDSVEARWLGSYLVPWPQAVGWPSEVRRGNNGPAVATIMEMAARVDVPYHGDQVFDAAFEVWLKSFQTRNGLVADGIVGRNTLLHLMTASINEPQLLESWE
jgi:general secretion pathway protein A